MCGRRRASTVQPMKVVTEPAKWAVRFTDGSVGTIWAAAYAIQAEEYVFSGLMDASPDEQAELDILGRPPTDPSRVDVVVTRLPVALVESVWTAD